MSCTMSPIATCRLVSSIIMAPLVPFGTTLFTVTLHFYKFTRVILRRSRDHPRLNKIQDF